MRLLVALVLSLIIHLVLLVKNPIVKPLHSSAIPRAVFQVTLKPNDLPSSVVEKTTAAEASHPPEDQPQLIPSEPVQESVSSERDFKGYWSTKDIERKALPISNIDLSMMNGQFVSGLPIKLRLFISEFGRVTKVEQISVLPQDEDFASRIEELMYELTFIPAKKDGLDVASYQELELSFNSLTH